MGDTCVVEMIPLEPMCVETAEEYPLLGKFAIRDMNRIIGRGQIMSVDYEEAEPPGEPHPDSKKI